ncbi:MAG TPA: dTDP-4-dehydrorhamnose 3,5-epimerase [Candidatus Omnitrophota bacterium]|nr:dTDP-4-dehydrorhamnose 3,5-epimerase [Candidatus Omnitrophota bacterium]
MKYVETFLKGVFILELERFEDKRGFFARSWCKEEFRKAGLNQDLSQCSISFNKKRGILRGMHYQVRPHEEAKVVRCTMGAIYDVVLDLREGSSTFKKWFAIELSAENRKALYIPEGCAHGFLTLEDSSEVFYQISEAYHPECSMGVRWNDPAFKIQWPNKDVLINARDSQYLDFKL